MPFESLSYRHIINVSGFPQRWLPLVFLYDPDLPLFPVSYFHVLPENWSPDDRPGYTDRAFGYIERVNPTDSVLEAHVVCNKDLTASSNQGFLVPVTTAVHERLGLSNPVTLSDVANAFTGTLAGANQVLTEIWHRVVATAYGGILPFGRLWDPVLGLARFAASWYSPGGRKGELIQTHYFSLRFGEPIQSAGGIPQTDFHLLPTYEELTDPGNPLNPFPSFRSLCDVTVQLQGSHIHNVSRAGLQLSRFVKGGSGNLNTEQLQAILSSLPHQIRDAAIECFNAFDKGPQRTVLFLVMLADLRSGMVSPATFSPSTCGALYASLGGTYQSPKTLNIYAQQAHGNPAAMPLDTWVRTFLKWPLALYPSGGQRQLSVLFSNSTSLGKVERLIWVAAQARKVHSSACDDALWCMKYGSEGEGSPRGANPLACNICLTSIRQVCPAFNAITNRPIVFNAARSNQNQFRIDSSHGNNTTPNQRFVRCDGHSLYEDILDTFSPVDQPGGFAPYPQQGHTGTSLTVAQFVNIY